MKEEDRCRVNCIGWCWRLDLDSNLPFWLSKLVWVLESGISFLDLLDSDWNNYCCFVKNFPYTVHLARSNSDFFWWFVCWRSTIIWWLVTVISGGEVVSILIVLSNCCLWGLVCCLLSVFCSTGNRFCSIMVSCCRRFYKSCTLVIYFAGMGSCLICW